MSTTRTMHTWIHRDADDALLGAHWVASGGETAWDMVLRVLEAFVRHQRVFENLAGEINVVQGSGEALTSELWAIDVDGPGLARLRARIDEVQREGGASRAPTRVSSIAKLATSTYRTSADLVSP